MDITGTLSQIVSGVQSPQFQPIIGYQPLPPNERIHYNAVHQLLSVLPQKSRSLIPQEVVHLTTINSPIADLYPTDWIEELDGKDYEWQSVPILPFVDIRRVIIAVNEKAAFTPERAMKFADTPSIMIKETEVEAQMRKQRREIRRLPRVRISGSARLRTQQLARKARRREPTQRFSRRDRKQRGRRGRGQRRGGRPRSPSFTGATHPRPRRSSRAARPPRQPTTVSRAQIRISPLKPTQPPQTIESSVPFEIFTQRTKLPTETVVPQQDVGTFLQSGGAEAFLRGQEKPKLQETTVPFTNFMFTPGQPAFFNPGYGQQSK